MNIAYSTYNCPVPGSRRLGCRDAELSAIWQSLDRSIGIVTTAFHDYAKPGDTVTLIFDSAKEKSGATT